MLRWAGQWLVKRPFTHRWAGKQGKGWTSSSWSSEAAIVTDLSRLLEPQPRSPGQSSRPNQSYPGSTAWLPGGPCNVSTYTMSLLRVLWRCYYPQGWLGQIQPSLGKPSTHTWKISNFEDREQREYDWKQKPFAPNSPFLYCIFLTGKTAQMVPFSANLKYYFSKRLTRIQITSFRLWSYKLYCLGPKLSSRSISDNYQRREAETWHLHGQL